MPSNAPYRRRNRSTFAALFSFATLLFFIACSPNGRLPQNSVLRPHKAPAAQSESGRAGLTVRVKLYRGEALSVKTDGFTFTTKRYSRNGSGDFAFTEPGLLTPKKSFVLRSRRYAGSLEAIREGGRWLYVNHVPLDSYLTSVVSHEMSPLWHKEALKAQAVVARTYLLVKIKERAGKYYDVDTTTNFQVYGGISKYDDNARRAVEETQGEVLYYQGELAQTFFHSSCGGTLASAGEVWGKDIAYLRVHSSPYCQTAPVYKWKVTLPFKEIGRRLAFKNVKSVTVLDRTDSKRVKTLKIVTSRGVKKIPAGKFRTMLGAIKVKSTFFGIARKGNAVVLTGRGFGHGVGMCQWGAKFQAEKKGQNYRTILEHYFPKTSIRFAQDYNV